MLDEQKIPLWKLKKAFKLNGNDINHLLDALLPASVFPYALWEKAYHICWEWDIRQATYRYSIEPPAFPIEKFKYPHSFPAHMYSRPIILFLVDISQIIPVNVLETGINYILLETYDDEELIFQSNKDDLFRELYYQERRIANLRRQSGKMDINSFAGVNYSFVEPMFIDTVLVDKMAALAFLKKTAYPFSVEVKGITRALFDSVLVDIPISHPDSQRTEKTKKMIHLSSEMTAKNMGTLVKHMKEKNYDDHAIVFAVYKYFGKRRINKSALGAMLKKEQLTDHRYRSYVRELLEELPKYNLKIELT